MWWSLLLLLGGAALPTPFLGGAGVQSVLLLVWCCFLSLLGGGASKVVASLLFVGGAAFSPLSPCGRCCVGWYYPCLVRQRKATPLREGGRKQHHQKEEGNATRGAQHHPKGGGGGKFPSLFVAAAFASLFPSPSFGRGCCSPPSMRVWLSIRDGLSKLETQNLELGTLAAAVAIPDCAWAAANSKTCK